MIDPTTDTILDQIKKDLPTIFILGYFFYNQIKGRFQQLEKLIEDCQKKILSNTEKINKLSDEINGHFKKN